MTVPTLDDEISEERAHLAASRAALRRMRERAQQLFHTGDTVAGDAYSSETLGRTLSRRVAELADDPTTPLSSGATSPLRLRRPMADPRWSDHVGRGLRPQWTQLPHRAPPRDR